MANTERSRPNRSELCCMLYVNFLKEINNVVDIQFRCHHLEFIDPLFVARQLKVKNTSLQGAWILFYKWTHNAVANDIL